MKPVEMVPTLETCRALREAGFPQETPLFYYVWHSEEPPTKDHPAALETNRYWRTKYAFDRWVAAPTLAEILAVLPYEMVVSGYEAHLNLAPSLVGWQACYSWDDGGLVPGHEAIHDHPAEAAALLWLRLHELVAETKEVETT